MQIDFAILYLYLAIGWMQAKYAHIFVELNCKTVTVPNQNITEKIR